MALGPEICTTPCTFQAMPGPTTLKAEGSGDIDLQLDLVSTSNKIILDRLDRAEVRLGEEQKVELLQAKVEHFVQSLMKVKTLPAVVNALERRVDGLDRSLQAYHGGGGVSYNETAAEEA